MRSSASLYLVAALSALLFISCGKTPFTSSKEIVFTAESASSDTKVAYSNEYVTDQGKKIQRIDWVAGDQVNIWSNRARTWKRTGAGSPLCIYNVVDITPSGRYSRAGIEVHFAQNEGGLQWEENGEYVFVGFYPATSGSEKEASIPTAQNAPASLPITFSTAQRHLQNGMADATKLATYGYHLAMTKVNKTSSNTNVTLSFEPYFTAFEFHIVDGEKAGLKLHEFKLDSNKDLAGKDTFTINKDNGGNVTVTSQVHDAVPAGNADLSLAVRYNAQSTFGQTTPVSLPQDGTAHTITVLGGMNADTNHQMTVKLTFLDKNNQPNDIRQLDLKTRENANAAWNWIPFPRGKKAIIHLNVVPTGISFTVTVEGHGIEIEHYDGGNGGFKW